jgi:hypothetical protein
MLMASAGLIESRLEGLDLDWFDPFDPTTHTASWADDGTGKTMIRTALCAPLTHRTGTPSAATTTDSSRNWFVHATSATSSSRVAGNSSDSLSKPQQVRVAARPAKCYTRLSSAAEGVDLLPDGVVWCVVVVEVAKGLDCSDHG